MVSDGETDQKERQPQQLNERERERRVEGRQDGERGEEDGDVAVPHNIGTLTAEHVILYNGETRPYKTST